ncbi:MAG: nucleotidyl transferase AbiEii/AbiGii toxin family protein [Byssovorax sp.]
MTWPVDRAKNTKAAQLPGYPAAYTADARRPDVFDPALKHYLRAFVKGPPSAGNEAQALAAARSRLQERSLHALARSPARDLIVLRGSTTLEAWFPDRARRAHDIDLVVRKAEWDPDCPAAETLLSEIRRVVGDALVAEEVQVLDDEIKLDGIWTYERAEGRRLSVPWVHAGSMRDVIQIDIVFREPLQDAPALEILRDSASPRGSGEAPTGPSLYFASRAESLAWKLLWLDTDMHPQAKDLYDAVLLAENVALPIELVRRVFAAKAEPWKHGLDTQFVRAWEVEWASFALEYPELATDDCDAWIGRLASTLKLTD